MGFIHYQQQNYEEAQTRWDRALELNPSFATVHNWRGSLMANLGQYDEEISSRRAAAELDPMSASVLNNYATALFRRGKYDDNDRVLQRLKAIGPQFYNFVKSWQAWQRGMPSEAVFALLDGLDFDPDDRRIPAGLTNMFGLLGLHDESLRQASESFRYLSYQWNSDWATLLEVAQSNHSKNPGNRRAIAALGQAYLASGDVEAATSHLERFVKEFEDGVGPSTLTAGYVALIRTANGDEEGARTILNGLKARHERALTGGLDDNNTRTLEAMISLINGSNEAALAALDGLSQGMGIEPQVVASLRLLTPLNDDARFDEILTKQKNHFAEERDRLLDRICGDEGWQSWRPLPETCAGQHPVD